MKEVKVKICGITLEKDLAIAVDAGADAVGFVIGVASSPRSLTLERAKELMKLTPVFVDNVAVTVPDNLDTLTKVYGKLRPDAIQIHGEKLLGASTLRGRLPNVRLIRAVRVGLDSEAGMKAALGASKSFHAVLLDSLVQGKSGGTGVVHNWELSKRIKKAIHPKPLILAGGLKPENIKEAIQIVQPYAVDVSSGVELRPGVKDPKKVFEFVKNAKEANVWKD